MTRKRYAAEDKVLLLREHLEKNIPVSDICEKNRIHPNQFYQWKKELFENASAIFMNKSSRNKDDKKIEKLEQTLKNRNEVIAELLQENINLKKSVGEI